MVAIMQKSFNSGEWAPQLYSRVDIEKYRSGAALLRNFFVDFRGGASTRAGTRYILPVRYSNKTTRLIPFQASSEVTYVLEFGDYYIRFYNNGNPILESALSITHVSNSSPCIVTVTNSYVNGDWVYINGVGGTTQLNGNYYQVTNALGGSVQLLDLTGTPVDASTFGAYTSGGTIARIYTLASPFAAGDVNLIKWTQNVTVLILCHPNYAPQSLTLLAYNNWLISSINFGAGITAPTAVSASTTLSSGSVNYAYGVTTLDSSGNESSMSSIANLANKQNLSTTAGSNSISWSAATAGVSYNVYKSNISYFGVVPSGVPYGYIGNTTGTSLVDTNISADFTLSPPIAQNPFAGGAIDHITQGLTGTYTTVPSVIITGGSPTAPATASAVLGITGLTLSHGGSGYAVNDTITYPNGVVVKVLTLSGSTVVTVQTLNPGALATGTTPANPVSQVSTSGSGVGCTFIFAWGVLQTNLTYGGVGYTSTPSVGYSPVGATATAVLTAVTAVNPSVPTFFQQRLCLAAPATNPEGMNFSQPGRPYNFNISSPIISSDAISVSLASGQLETIKALVPTGPGLVVLTDKSSWLLTGGSLGSAISPSAIVASRNSFNGANDMPPIINNYDILFVEYKGSSVRDATYNYYAQVFTGTDISAVASHRFLGYQLTQWAWAQAPFKLVWAIRNDGAMLSLTFAKEEEFVAWAYHDTQGNFKSIATVTETTPSGMIVDAVYLIVQRMINGNSAQYVERMADRIFNSTVSQAWCVDAGIQYSGSPTAAFSGAQQLAGCTVTGLADGKVIPPFTMPVSGSFTLSTPASLVTIGLPFTAQLQTLPLDMGEPTIQGKQKRISSVVVRCAETLGLSIGSSFTSLVNMQDLVVGNVGSLTNSVVTGLVTGDAQTIIDPMWSTAGQFCIQQSNPFPATITGIIPQFTGAGK